MSRKIDGKMLQDFIDKNFKSNLEFSKKLGISYSHLYYIIKESVELSDKTLNRFKNMFIKYGENINDFIYPEPIFLKNLKVKQIDIFENDELICSISSENIIYKKNIKVECRPY